MNNQLKEQLRQIIREVIREEIKHGMAKKDPKTGITTTNLESPAGKKVGYMKHKETLTGGFVAGGRIGPKAAEKKDEAVVFAPSMELKAAIEKLRQTPTHKTKTSQHARVMEKPAIPKDLKPAVKESDDTEKPKEKTPGEDTPKDKPKPGEGRPDLTPYERAVAAYYQSKGSGPGSYTGD